MHFVLAKFRGYFSADFNLLHWVAKLLLLYEADTSSQSFRCFSEIDHYLFSPLLPRLMKEGIVPMDTQEMIKQYRYVFNGRRRWHRSEFVLTIPLVGVHTLDATLLSGDYFDRFLFTSRDNPSNNRTLAETLHGITKKHGRGFFLASTEQYLWGKPSSFLIPLPAYSKYEVPCHTMFPDSISSPDAPEW